jgi:autotransporter-associated beta strand protein
MEVYDAGTLDISQHDSPGVTIDSLSGNGLVSLGRNNLTVGAGNFDSTFDGIISGEISEGGGSLTKIGLGTLILTQPNSYFSGTQVNAGTFLVRNTTGSATGTGLVQVLGGTLGGDGVISGGVTVGGSTRRAALLAGTSVKRPGVLTIQEMVTLNSSAACKYGINSDSSVAAQLVAGGVTINGALFSPSDSGTTALPTGTVFTVINNTSLNPISGTFSNLPDGGTIVIGSNTFQANYEGGDGNDLTLTVVP